MASYTPNYNLKKPAASDWYSVDDQNGNMDAIDTALAGKVNSVAGKGLSTNDYTNAEKQKLGSALTSTDQLVFSNVSVAPSSFASDATYANYPQKVVISCTGVTADYVPTVNLPLDQAVSGNFAPVALAGTGTVTIYAKEAESATFTIPSIVCVKGGAT